MSISDLIGTGRKTWCRYICIAETSRGRGSKLPWKTTITATDVQKVQNDKEKEGGREGENVATLYIV